MITGGTGSFGNAVLNRFPEPFALLHHLRLDDRDHRIATPEGEGANLEECLETLPVKIHTLLLDV